jgi:hypothetical protein
LRVSAIALSIYDPFGNTRIGNLVFKEGFGHLETLMFVGVRIEDHARAGAETFDLTDIVLAKLAPLIESARVCEDMSPACPIDMEVNRLLADRTL